MGTVTDPSVLPGAGELLGLGVGVVVSVGFGAGVESPLICFTASGDTAPVPPIIVVAVSDLLASSQALVVEGRAWGWVKSIGVPFKPAAAEAAKASGKSTPVAI